MPCVDQTYIFVNFRNHWKYLAVHHTWFQPMGLSICSINLQLSPRDVSPGYVVVSRHSPGQWWVSGCGQWGGAYRLAAAHVGAYMVVLMRGVRWRDRHTFFSSFTTPSCTKYHFIYVFLKAECECSCILSLTPATESELIINVFSYPSQLILRVYKISWNCWWSLSIIRDLLRHGGGIHAVW